MADKREEESWWEQNVEDPVAAAVERDRQRIPPEAVGERLQNDIATGVLKGVYGFGKGLLVGLADIAIVAGKLGAGDPQTYENAFQIIKKLGKEAWIDIKNDPAEVADQNRRIGEALTGAGRAVYASMKKDWEKAERDGRKAELISKWATGGVLNVAAFFVGAGEVRAAAAAGKTGELLETGEVLANVAAKCPEVAAATEEALSAEKAVAAENSLAAEKAAAAKEPLPTEANFKGKLAGKEVEFPGVKRQRVTYTKRDPAETMKLRKEFNSSGRKNFVKGLADDPVEVASLKEAGLTDTEIAEMKDGVIPEGYQVHHKLPIDDNGTNDASNLVLIKNDPYHKAITNEQRALVGGLRAGESKVVDFPIPEGSVYPP